MTNKTKRTKLDRARELANGIDVQHTCHTTQPEVCPTFWDHDKDGFPTGDYPHAIASSLMLEGTYGGRWKQGSR